eukprot:CCRYP_006264-RA/>CCRYP_006264-RA protein AED:0.09 eAED:1.00 QI:0/-1/0/1/-1/0/1/0/49
MSLFIGLKEVLMIFGFVGICSQTCSLALQSHPKQHIMTYSSGALYQDEC